MRLPLAHLIRAAAAQLPRMLKVAICNRYTIFLAFLAGYTAIVQQFDGLPMILPGWRFEIPLVLYLYFYLNCITRPSRLQPWIAAAPILLLYITFDIYFLLLGRLLKIADFAELPELLRVTPIGVSILAGLIIIAPFLALFRSIDIRRIRLFIIGALPICALLVPMELYPEYFMAAFEKTQKEIFSYSDLLSAQNNGRLGMMLYSEARRQSSISKIAGYRNSAGYMEELDKTAETISAQPKKRNVHLIMLESFLDPKLLRAARYSRNVAHPAFEKLLFNSGSLSISPMFGGGTAQAEFELLCGAPALAELSAVDFDVFTGAKTFCLPYLLSKGGYQTIVSNAYVPDFFNSTNAYNGVGFEKIYYPHEYAMARETYFTLGESRHEPFMFDGDLFPQNLEFIAQQLRDTPDVPIFNYVVSMYGHTPHILREDRFPKIIDMLGKFRDGLLERAVNQYYYRTKALAAYLYGLLQIDPQSLIVLVSDHLPPLTFGPNTYRSLNYLGTVKDFMYLNRMYIIQNRKALRFGTIHHYDVPAVILNFVTRGDYCRHHLCRFTSAANLDDKHKRRDEYLAIIAQAMSDQDPVAASKTAAIPRD